MNVITLPFKRRSQLTLGMHEAVAGRQYSVVSNNEEIRDWRLVPLPPKPLAFSL